MKTHQFLTERKQLQREVCLKMLVAVLIGIMISIVVGVSLVPVILETTAAITSPAGLAALVGVLPYVFVAVILLGAVAWIGGQG